MKYPRTCHLVLRIALILLAILGGCRTSLPKDKLESRFNLEDPCLQKQRCVVVYLTPWCPHCRTLKPVVVELHRIIQEQVPLVGFKVVVGKDSQKSLKDFAAAFGSSIDVHFDPSGAFFRNAGGSGVPAWFVWDDQGVLVKSMAGRPRISASPHDVLGFMRTVLQLDDLMQGAPRSQ